MQKSMPLSGELKTQPHMLDSQGLLSVSLDGIIQSFDQVSERIFRCSKNDAVGQHVKFLISGGDSDRFKKHIDAILTTTNAPLDSLHRSTHKNRFRIVTMHGEVAHIDVHFQFLDLKDPLILIHHHSVDASVDTESHENPSNEHQPVTAQTARSKTADTETSPERICNIDSRNDSLDKVRTATLLKDISEKNTEEHTEEKILNNLYTITADRNLNLNEIIKEILKLGNLYFATEHGCVQKIVGMDADVFCSSSIDGSNIQPFNAYKALSPSELQNGSVALWDNQTKPSKYRHFAKMPSKFIAVPIFVNRALFGVLSFYSSNHRECFTSVQKIFFNVMSKLISTEIERDINVTKLEETNEFFNAILNASTDTICVKDDKSRIVKANQEYFSLFPESERESIIGSTTYEHFNKEDVKLLIDFEEQVMQNGYGTQEYSFTTWDGKKKSIQIQKVRFQDEKNNKFLLSVGRDTTDIEEARQKLQESQERYELAVKGSSVGLWDWNLKTDTLFLSDRYKEIMNILGEDIELSTNNFLSKIHPDDKERVRICREKHLAGLAPYDVEYRISNNGTDYIWIHARGQAVWNEDGVATRIAGSVDNISKRKQAEEELIRSNAELERFAYVASHDLQEPLRMVSSFTQLLKKNYSKVLDDQGIQYLDFACESAHRMQNLVRDLLTYARVGNPSEEVEEVDLNQLKETVERNLAESLTKNNATIEWDQLPKIIADPSRLCSVFQNLIGNALKYRRRDVSPHIVVNAQSQKNKWIFTVSDNGIGMKQAYCEQIFEPFKRLHRKEEYPGTGMGLAICRKTVEGLGGKIWAISEVGRGSIFYLMLPKIQSNVMESKSND